jgi:hypothetical protein
LLDFANEYIEALENPADDALQTDLIFKQEVHRVLEAAVRVLKRYREEPREEENQKKQNGDSRFEVFDPAFFKHIESLRRRMKARFVSHYSFGAIENDKIELIIQPRLEWQLDPSIAHSGNMAWYHLQIANFLSQSDLVSALRQCPWCRRLFLSTHSQKKYCRQRCSRYKALDDHIRRKEVADGRPRRKPSKRRKKKREVKPRPLAEKTRIGDLRVAKEKLEKEKKTKEIVEKIRKESDPHGNV